MGQQHYYLSFSALSSSVIAVVAGIICFGASLMNQSRMNLYLNVWQSGANAQQFFIKPASMVAGDNYF